MKTKFFVPPLPPGHILRGRLIERWRSAVDRRVTVITAPAGFGKSTAIAELFAATERPSAFLSLDADDADPVRLWSHVGVALRGLFGDALGAPLWGRPGRRPRRYLRGGGHRPGRARPASTRRRAGSTTSSARRGWAAAPACPTGAPRGRRRRAHAGQR
ncbi:MAG: hypothetical protein AAFY88_27935, partial [Acidobacteriota bacterium]